MSRTTQARASRPKFTALRIRRIALAVLLTCLLGLIFILTADVRRHLRDIEQADSDNGQWVMMQTEVEVLRFRKSIISVIAGIGDLSEVRRWFDVTYSRVQLLSKSPLYSDFIRKPENRARVDAMMAFLQRWVPVIDGPDGNLIMALQQMEAESEEPQRLARELALAALVDFSANTDATRATISTTLVRLAALTGTTIALLAIVSLGLSRLYRITQTQAEENKITSDRLQMIISTSPDAIVVTNRGGWVVEFNPAAQQMFGLKREDVLGRLIVPSIFAPEHLAEYQDFISAAIARAAEHGPQRFELEGLRSGGFRFPLEISIATRTLERGALIVAFMRDISASHQARVALHDALAKAQSGEKAKAEFLAVMSHEMRTPLNGLLGSMDLLKDTVLNESQAEYLRIMEMSGNILLTHVNSVLDISQAEAGEIRPQVQPFNLDQLIADCLANQTSLAHAGGNTLVHSPLSGRLGEVQGDARRLRQILLNLIGNAVKFTRNGAITLETERLTTRTSGGTPGMIEFRVIDTGIGIAAEDQARIFDDFQTIDSSYRRQAEGTGLGLGIVRRLTAALSGEIGVESEPGEGSVFWLRLPLPAVEKRVTNGHPILDPPVQGPAESVQPLDILIIEDNEINRFLLRRLLEDEGHSVTEAVDGLEGVEKASLHCYDVIVTDISMPRMDGVEATRAIRSGYGKSARTRIIALTAHALPDEKVRFLDAGIDLVLTKPVTRNVLTDAFRQRKTEQMPQNADVPDTILDEAPLRDLKNELGDDILLSLVQRMLADGEETVQKILGQAQPDLDMAKTAHQLAGSCATFGALRLRRVLAQLEIAIKTGHPENAHRSIAALPQVWAETRAALSEHLESPAF